MIGRDCVTVRRRHTLGKTPVQDMTMTGPSTFAGHGLACIRVEAIGLGRWSGAWTAGRETGPAADADARRRQLVSLMFRLYLFFIPLMSEM